MATGVGGLASACPPGVSFCRFPQTMLRAVAADEGYAPGRQEKCKLGKQLVISYLPGGLPRIRLLAQMPE